MKRALLTVLALALTLTAPDAFAKAKIIIQNADPAGVGFNDPTPAAPIGGNEGRTLGEQRLNAFQRAADIWGGIINSNVDIIVQANFRPIGSSCEGNSVTLGAARAGRIVANFDNAPKLNTWYPVALANALAGTDLVTDAPDIIAEFNSLVDSQTCLGTSDWYYGLDAQHGEDIDLVVVLLHEFAHGLGMSSAVALSSGSQAQNRPSIYESLTFDKTAGLFWTQMNNEQRRSSALNTSQLVWTGESTRAAAAPLLSPVTSLNISNPTDVARDYDIGTAAFGPRPDLTPLNGRIVAAADPNDADGASVTDGCSAFTNAGEVNGNIALVDRGNCTFVVKAKNAQNAGARGLIVVDNTRETCMPPSMGGDDTTIRIPVISLNINDGARIRAALASSGVNAMLRVDGSAKAGASEQGFVRLFAPCTLASGSSVHHWDSVATPNLLMEPNINDDLKHEVDISVNQLIDIGWSASVAAAPPTPAPTSPTPSGRRSIKRGK